MSGSHLTFGSVKMTTTYTQMKCIMGVCKRCASGDFAGRLAISQSEAMWIGLLLLVGLLSYLFGS